MPLDGLRARLTVSIALILMTAGAITFVAIYRGTGAQLQDKIDRDLRLQLTGFLQRGLPAGRASPAQVEAAARRYVSNQPFAASARLLVARVAGAGTATNEPELLGLEPATAASGELESPATRREERREARRLRTVPPGYSIVEIRDVGRVRLLTRNVARNGTRVATLSAGEPLAIVDRAQNGIARTFAVIGSLTLLAAMAAGYLLATRTTAPLRRMVRTARAVDSGELSHRIDASGSRGEVRVLAEAFNHMLDRLQAAFDRQRAFAADASHELRTPLTILRGQIEVLARQTAVSPEDVRRVEQAIGVEIGRMQRLTEDLLLLARADESRLARRERVAIGPFIRKLFDDFHQLGDRHFALTPGAEGDLEADPDLLAQLIRNLVRNAVEHTRPGAGRVSLEVGSRGDRLVVAIDDDGPGIPADQRERVFDRFHRVDAARSRSDGGSGLGLAIARAIVDAHGGRIRATESPLGGARVEFELPGFAPSQA